MAAPPSTLNGSNPGDYVLEVAPHDVLFGRGSGPNDHEGNIKFRDLVAQRKAEYMATNHRQTKANIAKSIVDQIFAVDGRFLKKLEPNEVSALGYTDGEDVYQVVENETVMEKAKQALRQNRNREDGGGSISPKPVRSATTTMDTPSFHLGGAGVGMPMLASMPTLEGAISMSNDSAGGGAFQHGPVFTQQQQQQYLQQQAHYATGPDVSRTTGVSRRVHQEFLQSDMIAAPSNHHGIMSVDNFGTYNPPHRLAQLQELPPPQSVYMDDDGYATYSTPLDDPVEHAFYASQTLPGGRGGGGGVPASSEGSRVHAAVTGSGPRRSLLGGRRGDAGGDSRRESLQLPDVFPGAGMGGLGRSAESMHMSDLMESFRGMSTAGELNSSTDTIGTIDNLMGLGGMSAAHMSGISNMSTMSMSSTTSLFRMTPELAAEAMLRSNSNSGGVGGGTAGYPGVDRVPSNDDMKYSFRQDRTGTSGNNDVPSWGGRATTARSPRTSIEGTTLGGSDLWNSKQLNSLLRGPLEGSSNMSFRNVGQNSGSADPPSLAAAAAAAGTRTGAGQQHAIYDIDASSSSSPPNNQTSQKQQQQHPFTGQILPGERKY